MGRGAALFRTGVAYLCSALAACGEPAPLQPTQTLQAPQPGDYVLVRVSSYALPYPISADSSASTRLLDDTLTLGQANDVRQVWRIRRSRAFGSGVEGYDSTSTVVRTGSYVSGSDRRGPLIEIRGALQTSQVVGPSSQWAESPVTALASETGITIYAPSRWRNWEVDIWEYRRLVAEEEELPVSSLP